MDITLLLCSFVVSKLKYSNRNYLFIDLVIIGCVQGRSLYTPVIAVTSMYNMVNIQFHDITVVTSESVELSLNSPNDNKEGGDVFSPISFECCPASTSLNDLSKHLTESCSLVCCAPRRPKKKVASMRR